MYLCIYAYIYVHVYIYIYIYIYTYLYISHCNKHRANPCNALQHAETYCNILHHIATNCNTLQHTLIWCFSKFILVSALPLKSTDIPFVHCNTHCNMRWTHYNALQHTATHSNTCQHDRFIHLSWWARNPQKTLIRLLCTDKTATHCNTLQQTATWRIFVPVLLSAPPPQRDRCVYYALRYTLQHAVNTLQRTATHCNTLQHTATHTCPGECTTPQRHKYVQLCTAAHTTPRV